MARRVFFALRSSALQHNPRVSQQPSYTSFRSHLASTTAQEDALKVGEVGEVSGVPEKHLHRKVFIYSPARTASQQGIAKMGRWKINFISTEKWENPLMGWTSTGDPYASVGDAGLSFLSKEAAVEFAHKYGWEYTVKEPKVSIVKMMMFIERLAFAHKGSVDVHKLVDLNSSKPKTYSDNFKWKGPERT